jgi:cyclase
MLKNRLIPVLFLKNGYLVRSEKFSIHQKLGFPDTQVERYNTWDVDELIYLDISSEDSYDIGRDDIGSCVNYKSIIDIIKSVSRKCFMPLTVGGRIRDLEDIRIRMESGADKVVINTAAIENKEFITLAAKEFGSQAIVVSIDAYRHETGIHEVYSHLGKVSTGLKCEIYAKIVEDRGAGEIFLNSIDRDGSGAGYDIELIQKVVKSTNIPIIACGGVGNYSDFAKGLIEGGASAVAAGNIFHFKEMSYILAKRALQRTGMNVRQG